jgi:hypothetical protein
VIFLKRDYEEKGFIMKLCMKFILLVSSLLIVVSCTPSPPYEVRSPCVSGDGDEHTYGINPCVRRPANVKHTIA